MSNCVIYIKKERVVLQFIEDAVITRKTNGIMVKGTNGSRSFKMGIYEMLWTDDMVAPGDPISGINPNGTLAEIKPSNRKEFRKAVKRMEFLSNKTNSQLRAYVDNHVHDISTAKEFLKDLLVVTASLYKIVKKELR